MSHGGLFFLVFCEVENIRLGEKHDFAMRQNGMR